MRIISSFENNNAKAIREAEYGDTPGQIGNLKG